MRHRSVAGFSSGIGPVRFLMVLGLALASAACGPATATLDQIVTEQDERAGQRLTVEGTVVPFEEPDGTVSYILEDESRNRVLLLPSTLADGHSGEQVTVTGIFEFDPEVGRVLRVEELESWEAEETGSTP